MSLLSLKINAFLFISNLQKNVYIYIYIHIYGYIHFYLYTLRLLFDLIAFQLYLAILGLLVLYCTN
jgi:hypothetical protein